MELYRHSGTQFYIERKFRTIGDMTLPILADSGLPKSFWWNVYMTASNIVRMQPTRTRRGWMSPAECMPGGQMTGVKTGRIRRW